MILKRGFVMKSLKSNVQWEWIYFCYFSAPISRALFTFMCVSSLNTNWFSFDEIKVQNSLSLSLSQKIPSISSIPCAKRFI